MQNNKLLIRILTISINILDALRRSELDNIEKMDDARLKYLSLFNKYKLTPSNIWLIKQIMHIQYSIEHSINIIQSELEQSQKLRHNLSLVNLHYLGC